MQALPTDDPLSQQRRGKLLVMLWLNGTSLYLVIDVYDGITDLQILENSNFNLNINLSLEPPIPTALPLSAAFMGVLSLFTLSTPIGAYNDVRVEVCIIIMDRVFHDVLLSSISH